MNQRKIGGWLIAIGIAVACVAGYLYSSEGNKLDVGQGHDYGAVWVTLGVAAFVVLIGAIVFSAARRDS